MFDESPLASGLLFSSSISAVVIGLMLFMSVRLYVGNRRRAYRNLLVSLSFIFVYHALQLAWSVGMTPGVPALAFAGKLLQVFSMIVLNFAIFELYYKRRPRTRIWFYGLLAVGFLLAVLDLLPWLTESGATDTSSLATTTLLDGYLLFLLPLFALMFGPHIGQPRKYWTGLGAAFAAQVCVTVNAHVASDDSLPLAAALLNAVFYILLFMLLFERVVELLLSAYRSSITDGLTNLYNRRYFVSQLERALRTGKPVTAIFCDIDNFKRLNDTHGHHRADGVLKQVAALMMEETEGLGLAGRYGGEELVAFVAGPPMLAMQAAEAIRARTEKESLVTLSIGVSTAPPDGDIAAVQLLKQADQAMYHSKTSGKNRISVFADPPDADRQMQPGKR